MSSSDTRRAYWRANLRLLACLLSLWALGSFGCGILFADVLDRVRIPGTGFRLGFWFAQQGSIVLFCVLVFVYAWRMNVLERRYDLHEDEPPPEESA